MNERPELEALRFLTIPDITVEHLNQLPIIAEMRGDGTTAEDLVDEIRVGRVWMWEVGDGVVLTSVIDGPHYRTLFLDGLAGRDILTKGQSVVNDLKLVANYYQCQRIEAGTGVDKRWDAAAKRLGFEPYAVFYKMELG